MLCALPDLATNIGFAIRITPKNEKSQACPRRSAAAQTAVPEKKAGKVDNVHPVAQVRRQDLKKKRFAVSL